MKVEQPPWDTDSHPEKWVTLDVAAEKFRKHRETLRRLAVAQVLTSYFDGDRWWVRLDFSSNRSNLDT